MRSAALRELVGRYVRIRTGPLIVLGPVTVETVVANGDYLAAGDPYAAEELIRFRVSRAVRILPDGLLPLLTLPVHDPARPSDNPVIVPAVTRSSERRLR